jgi:hypothetical protein
MGVIINQIIPISRPLADAVAFKLLKPTGYVMHQQFNIQQLYALPTQHLCVLYLSENKERILSYIK